MGTTKTEQTGRMSRLIRVFAGRTHCHFVGFVMKQLILLSFHMKAYLASFMNFIWNDHLRKIIYILV